MVKYYVHRDDYKAFKEGKAMNVFTGREVQKIARMHVLEHYKHIEDKIEIIGDLDLARIRRK